MELFIFKHLHKNRIFGEYAFQFWSMFICNAIIPQLFWFKTVRSRLWIVFIISILINIGMWFERFNIIVTSLSHNYLPANWATYSPTIIEIGLFLGTLGMFSTGVLLFFRYIPMIAISEIKGVMKHDKEPDLTQFLSHETQSRHEDEKVYDRRF